MDLLQKKFREGMLARFTLGAWGAWGICGVQQTPLAAYFQKTCAESPWGAGVMRHQVNEAVKTLIGK